jgi:hypothetical protein
MITENNCFKSDLIFLLVLCRMKWQTKIKSIIKYHTIIVIYLSIAGFLYNYSANGHFHFNEAGNLVYHFHPLNNSDSDNGKAEKHTHTSIDFIGIYNYNNAVTFLGKYILFNFERNHQVIRTISYDEQFFIEKHLFSYKSLRAPPEKL